MFTDYYNSAFKNMQSMFSPVEKFNAMCIENTRKVIQLHKATVEFCSDMAMEQLDNAGNIKDITTLMKFNEKTMENAGELSKKCMSNAKEVSDMMGTLKSDITSMVKTQNNSQKKA